jgi:hypothetical protein
MMSVPIAQILVADGLFFMHLGAPENAPAGDGKPEVISKGSWQISPANTSAIREGTR